MTNEHSLPENISDDEHIARVVFSPSMVEDGEVSPSAFFLRNLRTPEDYVSVFRHDYIEPTLENVSMIHPPKDNSIYGYALLEVSFCRRVSHKDIVLSILSHPSKNNPFHAGIHFSKADVAIKGACTDPDFIIVAGILANQSELHPFQEQI